MLFLSLYKLFSKILVHYKNTKLLAVLTAHFGGNMNLSRIKLFGMFICALCKVQTVGFEKLATAFETSSQSSSSLRRIQCFMADYKLNTDLIAQLRFKLLPHKPSFRLLDRYIHLFGIETIDCLLADREFVGEHWLAYLNHLLNPKNQWGIDVFKFLSCT